MPSLCNERHLEKWDRDDDQYNDQRADRQYDAMRYGDDRQKMTQSNEEKGGGQLSYEEMELGDSIGSALKMRSTRKARCSWRR